MTARKTHFINPKHPTSGMPWCREGVRATEHFTVVSNVELVTCEKCRHLILSRKP